jgi:hypothetical protein
MAGIHKCPKCGTEVLKTWVNKKRKQVSGKCPKPECGKVVYLGKWQAENDGKTEAEQSAGTGAENKPVEQPVTSSGGSHGDAKRQPRAKQRTKERRAARNVPEQRTETGKPSGGGWFSRLLDFEF